MKVDERLTVHVVAVQPCDSPIQGRTYQPQCDCGFKGTHYESESRANQAATEHRRRAAGQTVTAR